MSQNKTLKFNEILGLRIKELRQQQGLSQMALAQKIGVSFQQVQKYAQGKHQVSASRLQLIALALNSPVSVLIDEAQKPLPSAAQWQQQMNSYFAHIHDHSTRTLLLELTKRLVNMP